MKFSILLFLSMVFTSWLFAQEDPPGAAAIEMLAASREAEVEEEAEELQHFYKGRKLNLNTVSAEEMAGIPGISMERAVSLVAYRSIAGNFLSIYELQSVPGWDAAFCRKIRVFFTVSDAAGDEKIWDAAKGGRHQFSVQVSQVLQTAAGYKRDTTPAVYPGSPQRLTLRYRYNNPKKMQWGFLSEKDAGEPVFKSPLKGFDHYSFYLTLKNRGKFNSITIGDYRVNLGQGLIQWQSLAFNKSAEVVHTMRQGELIKPNQSVTESGFYRGIAITYNWKKYHTAVFASRIARDANLVTDSSGKTTATSLLNSGLHRTASEFADRRSLTHSVLGASIQRRLEGGRIALNFVSHSFSHIIQKSPEPYNKFSFNGNRLLNASFDYALPLNSFRFFGEIAVSRAGKAGMVHGVLFSPAQNVDVSLLFRKISVAYHSFETGAFTEAAEPAGEAGMFAAAQVKVSPVLSFAAFADHFAFPFYRYRVHGATRGSTCLIQARLVPDKKTSILFRFAQERKNMNEPDEFFIHRVGMVKRKSFRIQAAFPVANRITSTTRAEAAEVRQAGLAPQYAYLVYWEANFKDKNSFSGSVRMQFMEIPTYDSRLYVYEHAGAGAGMAQMVYGKGFRCSLRLKKKFPNGFTSWFSLSNTIYANASAMGSGHDQIPGKRKTALNLQLIYEF